MYEIKLVMPVTNTFEELDDGEIFKCNKELYTKMDNEYARCLNDGSVEQFYPKADVQVPKKIIAEF